MVRSIMRPLPLQLGHGPTLQFMKLTPDPVSEIIPDPFPADIRLGPLSPPKMSLPPSSKIMLFAIPVGIKLAPVAKTALQFSQIAGIDGISILLCWLGCRDALFDAIEDLELFILPLATGD